MNLDGNRTTIKGFKSVIENLIDVKLKKSGIPKYISAKVISVHNDGTVDVCIPPDLKNIISNVLNKTGETLIVNDSVELCTKNGSVANSWVALKHGTNFYLPASLPIGATVEWYNLNMPTGFLPCDGRAISRTDYSDLFAIIGTTFGSGDGSTTFNLPNKQGRVSVGLNVSDNDFNAIGKKGGSKYLQAHTHSIYPYNDDFNNSPNGQPYGTTYDGTNNKYANAVFKTESTGAGDSGNLQPYITVYFIIKVRETASAVPLIAKVVNNLTSTSSIDALSANMGRQLNNSINALSNKIIPGGGSSNQVLAKIDSSDYAVHWVDQSGSGTGDYSELSNKPSINGVELNGNKTTSDLNIITDEVHIGSDNPTSENWRIWINPDEPLNGLGTEVVNSMNGIEENMAPSVSSVKSYINDLNTYSTEEQIIGKWIDGKPIYRKVIEHNTPLTSGANSINHGISNIGTYRKGTMIAYNSGGSTYTGTFNTTETFLLPDSFTNSVFAINVGSSWANVFKKVVLILEYTKTTD